MADNKAVAVTDTATGKPAEYPVSDRTHGKPVIEFQRIAADLGYFCHDPGYGVTSSCRSARTSIDGEKGELRYRVYPIEQLAEQSSYLEVCSLLLNGELPDVAQWEQFNGSVRQHTMVHEGMHRFMNGFRHDAHPYMYPVNLLGLRPEFPADDACCASWTV